MGTDTAYESIEPLREAIDATRGALVLEFGSPGCGYCRRAQPLIESAMSAHPRLRHLKIADGPGRPLGRTFRVKLWPTLVLLHDGVERERLVRPDNTNEIAAALAHLQREQGQSD